MVDTRFGIFWFPGNINDQFFFSHIIPILHFAMNCIVFSGDVTELKFTKVNVLTFSRDTDSNKSFDFLLNPICIVIVL